MRYATTVGALSLSTFSIIAGSAFSQCGGAAVPRRNFLGQQPSSCKCGISAEGEGLLSVHRVRRIALAALASLELVVLLAALAKPAYGYVDPGSGLLAVQLGGSMLAGGLFVLRSKIRRFFRIAPTGEKPETEKSSQTESSR
jgi:hypothetical protein